jgi:hypothetical protein
MDPFATFAGGQCYWSREAIKKTENDRELAFAFLWSIDDRKMCSIMFVCISIHR